jgi:hypothetical protein
MVLVKAVIGGRTLAGPRAPRTVPAPMATAFPRSVAVTGEGDARTFPEDDRVATIALLSLVASRVVVERLA